MKAARRDPLKEARDTITFATVFTLTVTGPVTLIAGVILLRVSRSEWLDSIAAAILGMFWWPRRRFAPLQGQQIAVHTSGCTPKCCHREEPSSTLEGELL